MQSYIEFILTFTTLGFMAMYMFLDCHWFIEVVGYTALLTEALLAVPQFHKNFKAKSTNGMR